MNHVPCLLSALVALAGVDARALAAASSAGSEMWVEVTVNMERRADFALVRVDPGGALFARGADVKDWGLALP